MGESSLHASAMSSKTLEGRVVMTTDKGVGARADVEEEVVHLSIAFWDGGVIESSDPDKPWCYHASRDFMLAMATSYRNEGCLKEFGMDGSAVKLVIPGIPFPLGSDFQGDQAQDLGGHISIYNRPANTENYTPPDLAKAKELVGQTYTVSMLPEGLHILVASENNDMKTGCCYYLGAAFDEATTKTVNEIQKKVGLPVNTDQRFHMSLAGLAPAWQTMHPKSAKYRSLDKDTQKSVNLNNDFQVFRKGDPDQHFNGFDSDVVTGWSTYAANAAAIGMDNGKLNREIAGLMKTLQSDERDAKIAELKSGLKDIVKTLGFPKSLGNRLNDRIAPANKKAVAPDESSQMRIMAMKGKG